MIRNVTLSAVLAIFAASLICCSGRSSIPAAAIPNIAGPWEFQATSINTSATFTAIDVALQEGQTTVGGQQQPNGQVSASGSNQIQVLEINPRTEAAVFGGTCTITGAGDYNLAGTIESLGGTFNFTYTENGNVFNVTGQLSADGKSFIGTYTPATGNNCPDSGSMVGNSLSKLAGIYIGNLKLPDATYGVTATLSESSSNVLTISLVATTPAALNFTLSGPVVGNAFVLQGQYQGQQITYEGYLGAPTGTQTTPWIYFVNATDSTQAPIYAGTLTPQPSTN